MNPLEGLFGDLPPEDIVPPRLRTLEDLKAINTWEGNKTWGMPGETLLDIDGIPNGAAPATETTEMTDKSVLTVAEVEHLGPIDELRARYQNIDFIELRNQL